MNERFSLQTLLEATLGSKNVYFQPPASVRMKYPAIVYKLDSITNQFADDRVYAQRRGYLITVIDANPDSEIASRVSKLPKCSWQTGFVSDNLNHTNFKLYY